ncbi:Carbohydrate-binding X8 domain superfamily protein [Perilla frutescens var. frutescens]|nr:Carbohydrate-binding X8 domain superfamily protein [Perilla frutescens var. frutescens]
MAAEAVFRVVGLVFLLCTGTTLSAAGVVAGNWCVARSDASDQALQTAIDYACGAGADCAPIQQNGLCFLPNTLQAHASYAFNSYYQRKNNAPDSCSFAGTSTVARTDPSYGSCVYPSSPRQSFGLELLYS